MKRVVLDPPAKSKSENSTNNFNQGRPAQSEKELEEEFIKKLVSQGYEWVDLRGEKLKENLRKQIEKLNAKVKKEPDFRFTDSEWESFYRGNFDGPDNQGVEKKAEKIHGGDCVFDFTRDNKDKQEFKNAYILDKKNPQNNHVQVASQVFDANGKERSRYDVTILVNGIPLVLIELKNRSRPLYEAFSQNNRYQERMTSLFEFVQIFVISNGTDTKYYSNTTAKDKGKKSFAFTSYWSYTDNKNIKDLETFTETFFEKDTLLEIIFKYCVFDNEKRLKILRPYQIAATEGIIGKVQEVINDPERFQDLHNEDPKLRPGGYIWHTTGSGKTLTSFVASKLASKVSGVHKVLFLVDRKELDQQTQLEYNNYSGGNKKTLGHAKSTRDLKKMLNDKDTKIIIATIQKLQKLMDELEEEGQTSNLSDKRIVMIMDECHRSQGEDTHEKIFSFFPKRIVFGFTGTPLLRKVTSEKKEKEVVDKSAQIFGQCLHQYKIVHAIGDQNVLKFVVDYVGSEKSELPSGKKRREGIARYVFQNFNRLSRGRLFNSIFAAKSIVEAIEYYKLFKELNAEARPRDKLKVALIFSLEPKSISEDGEEIASDYRNNLEEAIQDYNEMFESNFYVGDFDGYRANVAKRTRNKQIDILLVVHMFLTGYDAPCINTVWVDRNLESHLLIQAFSRANRLHKGKDYAHIVCFRDKEDTEKKIEEAFTLFALEDEDISSFKKVVMSEEELRKELEEVQSFFLEWFKEEKLDDLEDKKLFLKNGRKLISLAGLYKDHPDFPEQERIDDLALQSIACKCSEISEELRRSRAKQQVDEEEIQYDDSYYPILLERLEINEQYIIKLLIKYRHKPAKELKEEIWERIKSFPKLKEQIGVSEEYFKRIGNGNKSGYWEVMMWKFSQRVREIINKFKLQKTMAEKLVAGFIEDGKISPEGIKWSEIIPLDWKEKPKEVKRIREEFLEQISNLFKLFNIFDETWSKQSFDRAEESYKEDTLEFEETKDKSKEGTV